jgi:hypothetical protein
MEFVDSTAIDLPSYRHSSHTPLETHQEAGNSPARAPFGRPDAVKDMGNCKLFIILNIRNVSDALVPGCLAWTYLEAAFERNPLPYNCKSLPDN